MRCVRKTNRAHCSCCGASIHSDSAGTVAWVSDHVQSYPSHASFVTEDTSVDLFPLIVIALAVIAVLLVATCAYTRSGSQPVGVSSATCSSPIDDTPKTPVYKVTVITPPVPEDAEFRSFEVNIGGRKTTTRLGKASISEDLETGSYGIEFTYHGSPYDTRSVYMSVCVNRDRMYEVVSVGGSYEFLAVSNPPSVPQTA